MTKECYVFKKNGKCKFGDSCRYKHIKRDKSPSKTQLKSKEICPYFISKEGCKGGCKQAHAFKEDDELLEMFRNDIDIINIQVKEIDKLRQQMNMVLKLGEKDMYDLPTPTDRENVSPISKKPDATYNPPSLTFSSFLGPSDNSRYKHEARAAVESVNIATDSMQSNAEHSSVLTSSTGGLCGDEYTREIQQIERLYRGKCQILKNDQGSLFQIMMKPSDPDWNLTLLEVNLDIFIPLQYPSINCTIEFSDERVSESTLATINNAIKEELAIREGTMCLRPMLRWIDRNLGEMLQPESQFHTHSSLKVHKKGVIELSESDESCDDEVEEGSSSLTPSEQQSGDFLDKEVGTSVRLIDLNLHGSSHGLITHNILLLLQCLRCKTQAEVVVESNCSKSVGCARCSMELSCKLYKKLCLPSSSSIACVDLVGCSLADTLLTRSQIFSICTECSSSTFIGVTPGASSETWCSSCGHKMTVSFEGFKTIIINPPLSSGKQRTRTKVEKGFTEGQPLPDKGTCVHYKKSQRWFRFTCCERLFPCDRCHDAQFPECPLEQANRMVCGLCAKEQPVRGQCKFCHGEIAGNLRSHHWEGGKGCRDQVRMSNNDPRKHKNSKLKTQSQKDKRVGKKKETQSDQT